MRFMQAHGIDTTHVRKDTLHQFCKGGRPLYMRVGREVVRAPTFASPDMHQVSWCSSWRSSGSIGLICSICSICSIFVPLPLSPLMVLDVHVD